MSKHTPGPWSLSKDGLSTRNNQANCISGADGTLIVYGQANDVDARLIAAAPDLLEAIKRLIASNEAHATMHADDGDDIARMIEYALAFENAKKVLAKATGEPQ